MIVVIVPLLRSRQDKSSRQLTGTQLEQQAAADGRRHVANGRSCSEQQAGEQGPDGEMPDCGSHDHSLQFSVRRRQLK
jgi:hypothetical protein